MRVLPSLQARFQMSTLGKSDGGRGVRPDRMTYFNSFSPHSWKSSTSSFLSLTIARTTIPSRSIICFREQSYWGGG